MNRSTIEALYRSSFRSLVATAREVVHNPADAEDLVQDAFLVLLEGKADHLPPGPAAPALAVAEGTPVHTTRHRRAA